LFEYRIRTKARWHLAVMMVCAAILQAQGAAAAGSLAEAKQALAAKHFVQAKTLFLAFERGHNGNVEAELGLADAELGMHEYETAELQYRKVVAAQPEQWAAHKNLVVVEAALGRWDEFDRERALLRGARQRGAPGISARESDVIDSFDLPSGHWIVREYYEPVGRTLTRYNFERFSPDGRVQEYISLESAAAAAKVLTPGRVQESVRIGADGAMPEIRDFALNWYTGKAHGCASNTNDWG
jgi:tetratricopeptide (TPR) repeat protein